MEYLRKETLIAIVKGDITVEKTSAIVNAANNRLAGGGGVDGAIHRASGPQLMAECRRIGGCQTGRAVITKGYNLPAAYVIHTVGPVYSGQADDAVLLAGCYRSSLQLAYENNLPTLAFPSISTGVYGYPLELAAPIALETIAAFADEHPHAFTLVKMVLFDERSFKIYAEAGDSIFKQE
ncbi:MAG: O-acetyl-ADP-ribose deacetylase [Desulfarculales bacterium]|nr:O-acetyl-ADP-ribose deacetylase [Desulfarculales bacterium]